MREAASRPEAREGHALIQAAQREVFTKRARRFKRAAWMCRTWFNDRHQGKAELWD